MRIKIYRHCGVPTIAFPCLGKQSDDFYNHGMIDVLAPFIESGRMKLFCLDSNDYEDDIASYLALFKVNWNENLSEQTKNLCLSYLEDTKRLIQTLK